MAEHLLRKMVADAGLPGVQVSSAGTSPAFDLKLPEEAMEALAEEGVERPKHRPKALDEASVAAARFIFAMESHHRDIVLKRFPSSTGRVHLLRAFAGLPAPAGVADPYGGSIEDYRKALGDIKAALTSIVLKWKA